MQDSAFRGKLLAELLPLEHIAHAGNPLSQVLILKFELDASDAPQFMAGPDGVALHRALESLGFDPEDFCAFGPCADAELTYVLTTIDPLVVIMCDETARAAFERTMYARELSEVSDEINLAAGVLNFAWGMQLLNLGGFSAHLQDEDKKQLVWKYLKQLQSDFTPY